MRKEQPASRSDWPERWERGDLYRTFAAEAGISESAVGEWFRCRGYTRGPLVPDPSPYAEYPAPLRRLILAYPEGSAQRRWMERRAAAWQARR